jgi:hypothetical protein
MGTYEALLKVCVGEFYKGRGWRKGIKTTMRDEYDQSTFCTCMDISQCTPHFVQLIYANKNNFENEI